MQPNIPRKNRGCRLGSFSELARRPMNPTLSLAFKVFAQRFFDVSNCAGRSLKSKTKTIQAFLKRKNEQLGDVRMQRTRVDSRRRFRLQQTRTHLQKAEKLIFIVGPVFNSQWQKSFSKWRCLCVLMQVALQFNDETDYLHCRPVPYLFLAVTDNEMIGSLCFVLVTRHEIVLWMPRDKDRWDESNVVAQTCVDSKMDVFMPQLIR